jgi:hypothetical protein
MQSGTGDQLRRADPISDGSGEEDCHDNQMASGEWKGAEPSMKPPQSRGTKAWDADGVGRAVIEFRMVEPIKTAECLKKLTWKTGAPDVLVLMTSYLNRFGRQWKDHPHRAPEISKLVRLVDDNAVMADGDLCAFNPKTILCVVMKIVGIGAASEKSNLTKWDPSRTYSADCLRLALPKFGWGFIDGLNRLLEIAAFGVNEKASPPAMAFWLQHYIVPYGAREDDVQMGIDETRRKESTRAAALVMLERRDYIFG